MRLRHGSRELRQFVFGSIERSQSLRELRERLCSRSPLRLGSLQLPDGRRRLQHRWNTHLRGPRNRRSELRHVRSHLCGRSDVYERHVRLSGGTIDLRRRMRADCNRRKQLRGV